MPLPKKKKPIEKRVDEAFDNLKIFTGSNSANEEKLPDGKKEGTQKKASSVDLSIIKNKKRGRQPAKPNRTGRIHFCISEDILDSFNLAFPQEQLRQKKRGIKIDKSLLIENIIADWLKKQGYTNK